MKTQLSSEITDPTFFQLSEMLSLLFFRAVPLTTTTSLAIFESLEGLITFIDSRRVPVLLDVDSTFIDASQDISSVTSTTDTFCLPVDLNITHLLNFFSPLSSAVNAIDFHGIGTVSQKLSGTNIIDHRYQVTTFLSLSTALIVTSIASFIRAVGGMMTSN